VSDRPGPDDGRDPEPTEYFPPPFRSERVEPGEPTGTELPPIGTEREPEPTRVMPPSEPGAGPTEALPPVGGPYDPGPPYGGPGGPGGGGGDDGDYGLEPEPEPWWRQRGPLAALIAGIAALVVGVIALLVWTGDDDGGESDDTLPALPTSSTVAPATTGAATTAPDTTTTTAPPTTTTTTTTVPPTTTTTPTTPPPTTSTTTTTTEPPTTTTTTTEPPTTTTTTTTAPPPTTTTTTTAPPTTTTTTTTLPPTTTTTTAPPTTTTTTTTLPPTTTTTTIPVVTVPPQPAATTWDVIVNSPDLSEMRDAVETAGLVDLLNGDQPITVLAPSNAAFQTMRSTESGADLLDDPERLAALLRRHVIVEPVSAGEFPGRGQLQTAADADDCALLGAPEDCGVLTTGGDDESPPTVEGASFLVTDVEAANGLLDVIDRVLVP
jgi:uncharacterized surface protein with fasciclin (FAS1) repeats